MVVALAAVVLVGVVVMTMSRKPPHHNSTRAAMASTLLDGHQGGPAVVESVLDARSDAAASLAPARAVPSGDSTILDSAAREKIRHAIWGALGEAAPDGGGEPPSAAAACVLPVSVPDPPGDPGKMEPAYIQDRVRHDFFPFARDCYAEALKATSDLTGTIVLRFIIVGDSKIGGIVESVDVLDKSTLRDPAMIECIRESFLGTKFPPPEHGGWVSVEYPISFSPDDDDADD